MQMNKFIRPAVGADERRHEYGTFIIEAIMKDSPTVIYGNVRNSHLIDNLPDGCVEVACLVDRNGVLPCHFGELPEQLARRSTVVT